MISIFSSTPHHTPLKPRCLFNKSNRFRPVCSKNELVKIFYPTSKPEATGRRNHATRQTGQLVFSFGSLRRDASIRVRTLLSLSSQNSKVTTHILIVFNSRHWVAVFLRRGLFHILGIAVEGLVTEVCRRG